MKVVRLVQFGGLEGFKVTEAPEPSPGPGEVVIDLKAAALNRRDWWNCLGQVKTELPVTLGSDGAGVVAAVGEGVTDFKPGDEVVINPALNWGDREDAAGPDFEVLGAPRDGTFAERIVVPEPNVAFKPARLGWEEAAALSLAGLTAWRAAITCGRVAGGRSTLITGAGSGVSTFLVQIAAAREATVYVTSSADWKIERARGLGARGGFRYDRPEWPDQVRETNGGGFDIVIDSNGAPTWPQALQVLRPGGVLVSFGRTSGVDACVNVLEVYRQWRSIIGTTMGSPREYRAFLAHMDGATWRPVVDSVFPLDEVRAAFERLQSPERFGKVVLRIG